MSPPFGCQLAALLLETVRGSKNIYPIFTIMPSETLKLLKIDLSLMSIYIFSHKCIKEFFN